MDTAITSLAPAFAISIALQALVEWLDGPLFEWKWFLADRVNRWMMRGATGELDAATRKKRKAGVIRSAGFVVALVLTVALDIEVLEKVGSFGELGLLDNILAAFIVTMGADSLNQVVKFIQNAKSAQSR